MYTNNQNTTFVTTFEHRVQQEPQQDVCVMVVRVTQDLAKRFVGADGVYITGVQARTGCSITQGIASSDMTPEFHLRGPQDGVQEALRYMHDVEVAQLECDDEAMAHERKEWCYEGQQKWKILGTGAKVAKRVQKAFTCQIKVHQENNTKLTCWGSVDDQRGVEAFYNGIVLGSLPTGSETLVASRLFVPPYKAGAILGPQGATLKEIEWVTDTTIQIEPISQEQKLREILIIGHPESIVAAKSLVNNVITKQLDKKPLDKVMGRVEDLPKDDGMVRDQDKGKETGAVRGQDKDKNKDKQNLIRVPILIFNPKDTTCSRTTQQHNNTTNNNNGNCLIQVLVGRTNADMAQLKSMYYAKYHKSLESDVKGDVSGYFEKLLMMSMQ
ncbi:hypothetical protein BG005_003679, partial [Podila minutissima]